MKRDEENIQSMKCRYLFFFFHFCLFILIFQIMLQIKNLKKKAKNKTHTTMAQIKTRFFVNLNLFLLLDLKSKCFFLHPPPSRTPNLDYLSLKIIKKEGRVGGEGGGKIKRRTMIFNC
jgi:hypothetical protein